MRNIAVCSWSVKPASAGELVESLRAVGADRVQLALDPIRTGTWPEVEVLATLSAAGIEVVSGMMECTGEDYTSLDTIRETGGVRPDQHWESNLAVAGETAELARRLGLGLVSIHAGFLPEEAGDPERSKLIDRLRQLIDVFAERDVDLIFETGQESAQNLAGFLLEIDRPRTGVNFDPANMILYDKDDPIAALDLLHPWVRQIHVKDAIRTKERGTWGAEVPSGEGEVDWDALFDLLEARDLEVDLVIEREAGDDRTGDISKARSLVEAQLSRIGGAR